MPNNSAGLEQLHQLASQFGSRRWAIEGASNRFVAQFVNELLAKGENHLCHRSGSDQSISLPTRNKNAAHNAVRLRFWLLSQAHPPKFFERSDLDCLAPRSRRRGLGGRWSNCLCGRTIETEGRTLEGPTCHRPLVIEWDRDAGKDSIGAEETELALKASFLRKLLCSILQLPSRWWII